MNLDQDGLQLCDNKCDLAAFEVKILAYWKSIKAFETSLKQSEGKKVFNFYDGPPFATGLPHYGHILAGTIKDVVTRYAHQTGHHVERRFGWDCHGLPVEYEIDKKLGIKSSDDVEKMGVATYNAECRSIVMRYAGEWKEIVTRLGRWIDFDNDYKTLDPSFMESVWWVFKQMWEKDLVYQGFRVMPYSTACHTPLSNFESGQNYKPVNDPAVIVSFPLVSDPSVNLLAWTTTPWTLPSNLALCVNASMDYVKVRRTADSKVFILAKERLEMLFPAKDAKKGKGAAYDTLEEFKGETLRGLKYTPLFEYFRSEEAKHPAMYTVLVDSYVTNDSGVGIVHQAPAFGEDDYRVCLEAGVISKGMGIPCPVDDDGLFTSPVEDFKGLHVKGVETKDPVTGKGNQDSTDDKICAVLKAQGRLVQKAVCAHTYPYCWRSDTPLIYKAVPSWFVKVPQIKEQLLANNMKTYWVPEVVRDKRFHNWLTEARDWNISRNRYWGTPLPIWQNEDGTERVIIGSIEELSKLSGVQNITDLHKDSIDHITIPAPSGRGVLKRVPEVFDCWFESGSMPYGQKHYPFENKAKFEASFPADFIAEGLDQTRGWFYTLMVISTALFDQPAFKNLIVNGLVLAADGKKMSKRLKNYPDPMLIVDNYGADALRVYLINSPVVRAEKLEFKEPGVFNVVKDLMVPWFNSYRLFCEQARRHGSKTNAPFQYSPAQVAGADNVVDRWILASLQSLITFVKKEMEAYRLYTVIPRLLGFVNSLSKWYIRFQKERLKGDHGDLACASSLAVFFEVLYTLCILMAPITPFFVEFMYLNLRFALPASQRMDSVHFLMMPQADESKSNAQVERGMECLQSVIELGFKAREKSGVSLRVPLPSVTICHRDQNFLDQVQALESYVRTQLKVNDVKYNKDFTSMVKFEAAPDRRALGQSLLGNMKAAMTQIMALSQEELIAMESRGSLTLTCNGEEVTIPANDIKLICHFSGDSKVFCPVTEGGLLVMLTRTPDEACLEEGLAREFISRVQRLRKEAKLNSESKVRVLYRLNPESAPKLHACLVNRHALVLEGLRVSALAEHATPSVPEGLVHATQEDNIAAEPFVTWILNA